MIPFFLPRKNYMLYSGTEVLMYLEQGATLSG